MSFASGHGTGGYGYLEFALHTMICSACASAVAAKSAGERRARTAALCERSDISVFVAHISGPREALRVILGGSDASDGCSVGWYKCEHAVVAC